MTLAILESGALVLTILMGMEMRRQRTPWRLVMIRLLIIFSVLSAMIVAWRGV